MSKISGPLATAARGLSPDWRLAQFSSLLKEPVRNGIYKPREFHGHGVRIVNMGELFSYEFIANQEMKRVQLTESECAKYCLEAGDLLFARRSVVLEGAGKCSVVVDVPEPTTYESSLIRARPNRSLCEPHFLFYFFAAPLGRAIIASIASRTAVSGIRGSDLAEVALPIPPLPVQERIASVLWAYDRLAQNTLSRIRTLEQMARATYQEWFLRFRFPGHDTVPLEDSPVGRIPVGWRVERLGTFAEEIRRNVAKGALPDDTPYVGLEHIPRRALTLDNWESVRELGSNKLAFRQGEILFGKIRPYFHKVSVAPFDGVCSADTIVIRARDPEFYGLVVAHVSSDEFVAYASATANGAKMPRASWNVLANAPIVVPEPQVARQFSSMLEPVLKLQRTLMFKIRNLRATRDLLLPRLMSGRLSLAEAEAAVP